MAPATASWRSRNTVITRFCPATEERSTDTANVGCFNQPIKLVLFGMVRAALRRVSDPPVMRRIGQSPMTDRVLSLAEKTTVTRAKVMSVCARWAAAAAVLTSLWPVSGADAQTFFYTEVAKDGRIYVFAIASRYDAFTKSNGSDIGKLIRGPRSPTAIGGVRRCRLSRRIARSPRSGSSTLSAGRC